MLFDVWNDLNSNNLRIYNLKKNCWEWSIRLPYWHTILELPASSCTESNKSDMSSWSYQRPPSVPMKKKHLVSIMNLIVLSSLSSWRAKNKLALCHSWLGETAVLLYVLYNYVCFLSLLCKIEMIHFISWFFSCLLNFQNYY
jgi:hypothetical protein